MPGRPGASMELNGFKDKSEREDGRSAESDAARSIARRVDSQGRSALAQIAASLQGDADASKILLMLNRLNRHDIVRDLAEQAGVDAKKGEAFAVEAARAYSRSGERARAAEILGGHAPQRRRDYNFQYAAGRVYSEMRMHAEALACFKAALAAKPTQRATERVFAAHLALEQYEQAAAAAGRLVRAGKVDEALARDLAYLLRQIPRGRLDPDLADALSTLEGGEDALVPALIPHLIAADRIKNLRAAVERSMAAGAGWDRETLEALVPLLARRGEIELLLRLQDQSGAADAEALFARTLSSIPAEAVAACAMPKIDGAALEQSSGALSMLAQLCSRISARDYAREKYRIARLAMLALSESGGAAGEAIAQLVLRLLPDEWRAVYSGATGCDLAAALREARREAAAPEGSRLARLGQEYFAFHFERRRSVPPDAIESDVDFCRAAFDYFADLSNYRPAIQVPVGRAAQERLGRPALALGRGIALDKLGACALVYARPQIALHEAARFADFLWWYLEDVLVKRALPGACIAPGLTDYLNHVVVADRHGGASLTRFLQSAWSRHDDRRRFDLGNFIDRILFALELGAQLLRRGNEYLPFFEAPLRAPLSAACLRAFGAQELADALEGRVPACSAARAEADVQDVLLIGHGGRETGLGRNFGMLARGLAAPGIALTTLDFDAGGDAVSGTAARFYRERRSEPIAVLAVNAQDAPDAFIKDRTNSIAQCYVAGFFLWEMSAIPEVQKLGVALVDEVWAPTRYVADIYAPHKPAHVVGKALFDGGEAFLQAPVKRAANAPFRFVTVFDFDSSIERKNPLATALAFQEAFAKGESVELVIKTSNVDPRHWSNAWSQWQRLSAAVKGDPRIRLVTARLGNEEMAELLSAADCIVSLHRAEGFGYLMTDAMSYGVPVIATDYSGNVDFCDRETAYPVRYRLVDVPDGAARWRCFGAQWADPDVAHAAEQMRAVVSDYPAALAKAAQARARIAERYGLKAVQDALMSRIQAIRALPAKSGPV